jgi:sulfate adenylyltransferase subunit 1 (EFTu-like GTPase family)
MLSPKQKKIASKAGDPNKIDAKDFAVLKAEKAKGRGMGLEDEKLEPGKEYKMKAGGMTKGQKKVGKVMREFKAGKLHSGKSKKIVKNPKQAIAIALSEAGMSKKKMMGGGMIREPMGYSTGGGVRGGRKEIKGLRPAKLF